MTQPNIQREIYVARINKVLDYIEANLDSELTLAELAKVASFSPFHFHRIFGAMVGETLNQFIQRRRVEKAAMMLVHNHRKTITDIAFDCGFSGSATFARAFKDAFGMSASAWRAGGHRDHRKNRKTNRNFDQQDRKEGQEIAESSPYLISVKFDTVHHTTQWRIHMKNDLNVNVEVKDMPEMNVAYVRHIGPYAGDGQLFTDLFTKLMTWAGPRGLLNANTQSLAVYYDDPAITEESKLRLDVCVTVPDNTPVDGEIGQTVIPGGKFAVARFELKEDEYSEAWHAFYGGWLPESGYQPDDRPCYELYHNDPDEHPEGKHIVDICIPVKPL